MCLFFFSSYATRIRSSTLLVYQLSDVLLNQATGKNRQPEDKRELFFNLSSDSSNWSSEVLSGLLGKRGSHENENFSNKMMELFRNHDNYKEERIRSFIQKLNLKNAECGIKPPIWGNPLHMDIFQAFGAPGHKGVHSGLMVAYPGLDNWFITISVDLTAIPLEKLENGEIPENVEGSDTSFSGIMKTALIHTLTVVDGIDDSIWKYKGSVTMSLLGLFETLADAMKTGEERGKNYDKYSNNCIHFKNDILEALKDKIHQARKITNKSKIREFQLTLQ